MAMPEAAVHEHNRAKLGKNEVRPSLQFSVMQTIAQTQRVERDAQPHLRFGIPTSNPRHHPGAGCLVHYVCQIQVPETGGRINRFGQ